MRQITYITGLTLLLGFILTFMNEPVQAQQDLTIYPMQCIPQSNNDNPALIPDCKLHIGCLPFISLPVLTSFYYTFNNSGFNYSDVVHRVNVDSSYIDFSKTIKSLKQKNYISSNQNMELLSFGFKIKRVHYVNLSLSEKFRFRLSYPKDLISMLWYGNSQYIGRTMYFDGIGVDWTHYRELALGYSYQYSDKWTFGGKAKILFRFEQCLDTKIQSQYGDR
jgi:hypothetical protein